MGKEFSVEKARTAVLSAKKAGLEVGTWFIVGYPGETQETLLETLRFSSSLPSDYPSYAIAYPLPGKGLYERVADRILTDEWKMAGHNILMFKGDFSQRKLRFAILKGTLQHRLRKHGLGLACALIEPLTDKIIRTIK